jgi:dihydroxyacetone kinase-like protein
MQTFKPAQGSVIVDNLILAFQKNKQYLSDLDGLIGDGDHGINMNKGFTMAREELDRNPGDLVHGLKTISRILLMKIGGAMGPLYGKFFSGMAVSLDGKDKIGINELGDSLEAVIKAIGSISPAKAGDKTLLDTLIPAVAAYDKDRKSGKPFHEALMSLKTAAREGLQSTKNMMAKIGRASRLGERSIGVLDPGAASCCLILETVSESIQEILNEKNVTNGLKY